MLRSWLVLIALMLLLVPAQPAIAQLPVEDWTLRPDARAPSGVVGDALLPVGSHEFRLRVQAVTFEEILVGENQIPPVLVHNQGWRLAPHSLTHQVYELEYQTGILDWLGASLRAPFVFSSAEFLTEDEVVGDVSASGIGDVELRLLYSLHDVWPYRAHLTAGASFPTGAVNEVGRLPDRPAENQLLPYPLQPGDGTVALLPGAVFVAENAHGTVGIQGEGRIHLGENGRDWARGDELRVNVWMAYRFTGWVSGSARLAYRRTGELKGQDPDMDPWSSPMAHPVAQGGTQLLLPVGINLLFPEGPLRGNRISAEFVVPAHHDLHGPQLRTRVGGALTWSVTF